MRKRIIALLLALILAVGLLPTVALAAGETANTDVKSGSIGEDGNWTPEAPDQSNMPKGVETVSKTAKKVEGKENEYEVKLEVVLKQTSETKTGAAATALVLDCSGSMERCTKCGQKSCKHTTEVTYNQTYTVNHDYNYYVKNNNGQYVSVEYCDGTHGWFDQYSCTGGAGWYTESGRKDHTSDKKFTPKTSVDDTDTAHTQFYTRTGGSNDTSRMTAAKNAAKNFLKTYSGFDASVINDNGTLKQSAEDLSIKRYVAVIRFSNNIDNDTDSSSWWEGEDYKPAWYDVSTVVGYNKVLATINNASAGGGTNLDAGLTTASSLMDADLVKNLTSKNVIALTDGAPTYSKSYGDGGSTNQDICNETAKTAETLRVKSKVYTVCFAAESESLYDGGGTVGNFLKERIATQPAEGSNEKYAYNAKSAEDLIKVFKDITDTIVSGLNNGTVKDSLPTGITSTDFGNATQFELNDQKQFHKDVKTETVDGKEVTTYTYTKTYTVTIDPDKVQTTADGYAPLNDETTLTVTVDGKEKEIPFPIPAGKVTPTTFTVTWKSQDGERTYETDNNVARNSRPSYGGDAPTKDADWQYTYTFVGWAELPDQDSGKQVAELSPVTDNVTYYAAFSKTLKTYTVTGTINNGGNVTNGNQTVNAGGSSAAMTFTPAPGYKIVSVTEQVDNNPVTNITGFAETGYTYPVQNNVKANITVDVKTAKRSDLKYVVEHVEKGNESNVLGTENKTGTLDEVINGEAQKKTFPGFTYDTCSPESITISATEANNVITLYYTRNKYKVTYEYTGEIPTNPAPTPAPAEAEYAYEANVTIANAPAGVPGYTFEGWKREDGTEATNFTMPANDVKITGNWKKNGDGTYKLEYWLEKLDGTYENTETITGRTGTIGTTVSVEEADKKTITGFTFDASNTNNALSGPILEDGSLTLKLYYTRDSYKVTYQYTNEAPTGASALPAEATYKYGAEVTVAEDATALDHVFSGWSRTGKFNMPAEDVIITGSWTQATYDVNLSPYVKKTLEVVGTLPTGFSETFKVNVTVDGQPQQQGTVTMTAAGTSSFNMPTVALTKGVHTIMVQEVVDGSTKNSNIEYDTNQKTFVLNIPTSGAAAPVQYGTTNSDGNFVAVEEPAFVTITNTYTEPKEPRVVSKTVVTTDMVDTLPLSVSSDIEAFKNINNVILYPVGNGEASTLEVPYGTKSVTLLYKITVNAGTQTSMQFRDEDAERVSVFDDDDVDVSQVRDNFIVQFYRGVTTADIYVAKTYRNLVFDSNGECTVENVISEEIKATTTVTEKDPNKLTINFADYVQKELTATGTKTASDVDFTVDVKGKKWITIITSAEGEEAISTYADEFDPKYSRTLTAHFDSITGGEVKTTRFTGTTVEIDHAGYYTFFLGEEKGTRTGVTYDEARYTLYINVRLDQNENKLYVSSMGAIRTNSDGTWENIALIEMVNDEPVRTTNYITFHNTIDTGKDDYYPIIIPTIINKDTGMLNKTDHFAYVIGYPDGTVHPNGQITRAEVATIFFRLLRDEVRDGAFTTSNSYSDVAYGKWYNNPISTMSALGIITGYPDGTFKPNKPITRAEFAAIAARFDETQSGKSATFSDVIGHWAAKEIGIAYYNDWIKGYPDGTFKPDQNITRAEAMTLINRVLERKPESPADLLTNMNKWTDNMDTSKWYYLDVQEATNSHAYTRKTFNYELWRQMLNDPDWSRYER